MENYIVSARKYRPATFDTVVGQRALTTTLKNAIATGKLAHAYLFCGPRGVGKTTCARIFAKGSMELIHQYIQFYLVIYSIYYLFDILHLLE